MSRDTSRTTRRIILDPHCLHLAPTGAVEVTDLASYLAARRHLLHTVRFPAETLVPVVVRDGPWLHWFTDVPEWLTRSSPRDELQARHPAAALPPALDNAAILALDLLNLPGVVPTADGLARYFFPALPLPAPAAPTPAELFRLAQFVGAQAEHLAQPYLRQQWAELLAALPPALAPLQAANAAFAQQLAEGIYLGGLPAAAREWAHTHRADFQQQHGVALAELQPWLSWQVPPFAPADINPAWEQRLQQLIETNLRSSQPPLRPLKQPTWLPGQYRAEMRSILALAPVLDTSTLAKLEQRYAAVLTNDRTGLRDRLRELVPPYLAAPPTAAAMAALPLPAQFQQWQAWATTSFIPYKFWLDQLADCTDAQKDEVEKLANLYGDWLFDNYSALRSHGGILTSLGVRGRIADLLALPHSRVLWLIIDGFPAVYLPLLREALALHDLSLTQSEFALAPLPTITEIGVPALLNGLRPDDPYFTTDYKEAVRRAFPGYSTKQSSAVGNFADALKADADLCCLHWTALDTYQHLAEYHIEGTRADFIRQELARRIGQLAEEMRRISDRKTHLVISTDHGATRCLRNKSGIANAKINEAAKNGKKHERCVKLDGKLLKEKEHLDRDETYFLSPDLTHNPNPWVVARGYRYFGSNDAGYRHGGLTPEETIVPLVVAELGNLALKPLRLTFPETRPVVLGSTLADAAFVLENPNKLAVQVRSVRLLEDERATLAVGTDLLDGAKLAIAISFKLPRSLPVANGQVRLTAEISYAVQGEPRTERVSLAVTLPVNELDDIFGDL